MDTKHIVILFCGIVLAAVIAIATPKKGKEKKHDTTEIIIQEREPVKD